jgi:hypothetical protein
MLRDIAATAPLEHTNETNYRRTSNKPISRSNTAPPCHPKKSVHLPHNRQYARDANLDSSDSPDASPCQPELVTVTCHKITLNSYSQIQHQKQNKNFKKTEFNIS